MHLTLQDFWDSYGNPVDVSSIAPFGNAELYLPRACSIYRNDILTLPGDVFL